MTSESVAVTDFPVWENCPFQDLIPAGVEIRTGEKYGQQVMIFWWPEYELHIDMDRSSVNLDAPLTFLTPVIGNLIGAIWDKEFPDQFGALIRAQTQAAVSGSPLPSKYLKMAQRLEELNKLVPRATSVTQAA